MRLILLLWMFHTIITNNIHGLESWCEKYFKGLRILEFLGTTLDFLVVEVKRSDVKSTKTLMCTVQQLLRSRQT